MRPALYDDLEGADVAAVAVAVGLVVGRGGGCGPCPCCGADRRGREDKRPPVRVFGGGRLWRCSTCDATGDAAALCLSVATGATKGDATAWAAARELAERVGLTRPADVGSEGPRGPSGGVGPRVGAPAAPAPVPVRLARSMPAAGEVAALWAACGPVSSSPDVVRWLDGRGLRARAVEALDLARVAPAPAWPGWRSTTWARIGGRTWGDEGRLVLPCYGAAGELVTLRARRARDGDAGKEVAPAGYDAGPALYADTGARYALEGIATGPAVLVVVEGGPAWLRYACDAAMRHGPAAVGVVGLWAGAWSAAHADRLAARARRWTVAVDDDEAGDGYAAAVLRDAERLGVTAQRWRAGR